MFAPTDIVPEPLAALKSVSVKGAVKVNTFDLPKTKWLLKFTTNSAAATSVGASFNAVNWEPLYSAGTLTLSTIATFSVPV